MENSIPVPEYLREIGYAEKRRNNFLQMGIHCQCGCEDFYIYTASTSHNGKEFDEWHKAEKEYFRSLGVEIYGKSCYIDKNDGLTYETAYVNGKYIGKLLFDPPKFWSAYVIGAKCSRCGKKHLIFDNTRFGYNGRIVGTEEKADYGKMKFRQIRRKLSPDFIYKIKIEIENDESLKEFQSACSEQYTYEQYSEAFSQISVYLSHNGKKVRIYEEETS